MGPVTKKFMFLRDHLAERARDGDLLSQSEMHQVAEVIDSLLPLLEAMESRAIPPNWRVIDGGRGVDSTRPPIT